MMTTALHQLIAVEKTIKATEETAVNKAYHSIQKPELFTGLNKTYQPKDEEGFQHPPESKKVLANAATLVTEVQAAMERLIDHVATKDTANQVAKADIVLSGKTIVTGVPVSTLLYLEKKLVDIRTFVGKLPVLDPTDTWTWDAANQNYRSEPYSTVRQVKKTSFIVPAGGEATKEHKAQIVQVTDDVVEGAWTTTKLSGAVSPQWKQAVLHRVDELTMAVKRAREVANATIVTDVHIANALLNYVFSL